MDLRRLLKLEDDFLSQTQFPDMGWEAHDLGLRPQEVKNLLVREGLLHGRDFFAPGYVSDVEIRCLHRMASAYLLPSLYEGFGLPSLEALRAGCPTIVSAIPPLEEQNLLLGGTIPTFDPKDPGALADRIEEVLADPRAARARARRTGDRIPSVYDWRRTARAYLSHFAEVIEGRPPASSTPRS